MYRPRQRRTVTMQYGKLFLHVGQSRSLAGSGLAQYGHGDSSSSTSSLLGRLRRHSRQRLFQCTPPTLHIQRRAHTHRTSASIFSLNFGSMCWRYSGRIIIAAYSNADRLRPARWHSITDAMAHTHR